MADARGDPEGARLRHGGFRLVLLGRFAVRLDRGFDVYDDTFQPDRRLQRGERRAAGRGDLRPVLPLARRERAGTGSSPGSTSTIPHLPYDPPSPYQGERARPALRRRDRLHGPLRGRRPRGRLEAKGLLDRTLVVVAGDHGEGLGDKVEMGHGIFLYEETLRVPLIFQAAGAFPRPRVVESAVRLVDVTPTILETLGLGAEAADMEGQSLVSWIKDKNRADLDCLVETFYPRENFGWSELVGIVSGPWKYILAPRPELYDLKNDPAEKTDLMGSSPAKADELRKKLEEELLRPERPARRRGRPGRRPVGRPGEAAVPGLRQFRPGQAGEPPPDPKDKIGLLKLIQQAQAFELEEKFAEAESVYCQDRRGDPGFARKLCQHGHRPGQAEPVRPGLGDLGPRARPDAGLRGPPRPPRPHLPRQRQTGRGPGSDGKGPGARPPEPRRPDRRGRHPRCDRAQSRGPDLLSRGPWPSSPKAAI